MIVVVCVALLAAICAGQKVNEKYDSYETDILPKLPLGALKEYLTIRPEDADRVQNFTEVFQCLDENAENWPDDINICVAENWKKTSAKFTELGPRGEELKGPGDMDPTFALCLSHSHGLTFGFYELLDCFKNRIEERCGYEARDFGGAVLKMPQRKVPQKSCAGRIYDEKERKWIRIFYNSTSPSISFTWVPVRRRFVTETPAHVQHCLNSNEEYFQNELKSCNYSLNRTQRKDYFYELCLSYGLQSHCLAAAVEERCGMEGVGSAMERVRSEMPFDIWASCLVNPAFVYTELPAGVKFKNICP